MTVVDFISHGGVMPFTVALLVILIIGLLEGLGLLIGFAFSSVLDNLLPDLDLDVDTPELEHGAFSEFLTWLRVREVPVIVILIAFLTSFSVLGFIMQQVSFSVLGMILPWFIAVPTAFVLSMPGVRILAGILAKIMPRDETEAVATSSFIGRMATITLGTAKAGSPAQAKLQDEHGATHYVMLEPDDEEGVFNQGDRVLLIARQSSIFKAIYPDHEKLG